MKKKIYLTWEDFDRDMKLICNWLVKKRVKAIVAIPNGGLCMGAVIGNTLNIKIFFKLEDALKIFEIKDICVMDDVSDSGHTLYKATKRSTLLKTLTWCIKDTTRYIPNFYVRTYTDKFWISFPWESKNKKCKRDGTNV